MQPAILPKIAVSSLQKAIDSCGLRIKPVALSREVAAY